MNKKEKTLKNDILDSLEQFSNLIVQLNKGYSMIVCKEGKLDEHYKELRKLIQMFGDATITLDEE